MTGHIMKTWTCSALMLLAGLPGVGVSGLAAKTEIAALFEESGTGLAVGKALRPATKRSRLAKINWSALPGHGAGLSARRVFRLNLFPGEEFEVLVSKFEVQGERFALVGSVEGQPGSLVTLAGNPRAIAGDIFLPGRDPFLIEYAGEGTHRIVESDPSLFPPCQDPGPPAAGAAGRAGASQPADPPAVPTLGPVRRAGAEPEPPAIIEIFVSYTPKALKGAGGQDGMDALIDECILVTNQGFENSHINARLHLAGSWLTGYQESGNSATDLNNLLYGERNGYTGKSDDQGAYAAAVGPLLGIDITCTIVDSLSDGTAGRAGILTSGEVGRGKVGLSVVSRTWATHAFPHEIGHNLGCNHDAANATGPGFFAYSKGWNFQVNGRTYGTIMSYPGDRIPYFSAPEISFLGVPTGLAGVADNAATVRATAPLVAASYSPVELPASHYTFTTLAGSPGELGWRDGVGKFARFVQPRGVAVDRDGNVLVADLMGHTLRKITPDGAVSTLAGLAGSRGSADGLGKQARFDQPARIAVDSRGRIYVADSFNRTIRRVSPEGEVTTLAGMAGERGQVDGIGAAARFGGPGGLAVDNSDSLIVADVVNHSIRKVSADGKVTTLAGGTEGYADGIGREAKFSSPDDLAVDPAGNVFVADVENMCIRKVTPAGVVTTVIGLPGQRGFVDSDRSHARFSWIGGILLEPGGGILVADYGNNVLRSISPDGSVTTIAGGILGREEKVGWAGSADGPGPLARFFEPHGLARDSAGNIYVADTSNRTIRKGSFSPKGLPGLLSLQLASPPSTDTGFGFTSTVISGLRYRVQRTTGADGWTEITNLRPSTTTLSFADTVHTNSGAHFYRLVTP
jgi:hypothetical protein